MAILIVAVFSSRLSRYTLAEFHDRINQPGGCCEAFMVLPRNAETIDQLVVV
jgi:hypothetical protein